jgi:hypothetical protein
MARSGRIAWLVIFLASLAVGAGAQERHERGAQPGQGRHGEPGRGPGAGHGMERGRSGPVAGQHREPGRIHDGWRGDIRHFGGHDASRWQQGRWYHGAHGGRSGWWWIVGPTWYFYLTPVYPYPDPYEPPALVGIAPPPPPGTPPRYWYYCADPPGYYPYVAWCRVTWRAVPAYPPG